MKKPKRSILTILRGDFKKNKLPKVKMTDAEIKKEMALIADKKSNLSAAMRKAVEAEHIRRKI